MLETDAAKILLGLVLIALSVVVYVARVRDGQVNSLLQGANGQAATVVMIVFMFGGGLIVRALLT